MITTEPVRTEDSSVALPYQGAFMRRAIQASLLYIALSAAIPQYVSFGIGPLTIALVLSGVVAALGWRIGLPDHASMRRYLFWGIGLGLWVIVSGVASWKNHAMYQSVIFAIWVTFLIPGLASLIKVRSFRNWAIVGWGAGVAVYVTDAAIRSVRGGSVFDTQGDRTVLHLLGENRNAVNLIVLVIVPFLVVGDGGRLLRWARLPLGGLIAWWVLQSGGRAGLLGLVVVLLVVGIAQPNLNRSTRNFLTFGLIAAIAFISLQGFGGGVTTSTNRLLKLIEGERTDPDSARILLLRKAWHLAVENPAFGIGSGEFEGFYHPVIEEARTHRIREIALTYQEHNTYAAVMAENGFPALILIIGLSGTLLHAGAKNLKVRSARAALAAFSGVVASIVFLNAGGPRLFLPMALLLGAAVARPPNDERAESG